MAMMTKLGDDLGRHHLHHLFPVGVHSKVAAFTSKKIKKKIIPDVSWKECLSLRECFEVKELTNFREWFYFREYFLYKILKLLLISCVF